MHRASFNLFNPTSRNTQTFFFSLPTQGFLERKKKVVERKEEGSKPQTKGKGSRERERGNPAPKKKRAANENTTVRESNDTHNTKKREDEEAKRKKIVNNTHSKRRDDIPRSLFSGSPFPALPLRKFRPHTFPERESKKKEEHTVAVSRD
ncbi:hypothetical protein NPIL_568571 [Nephila pilipes]|uniref:Uncharacterized protein n=1 Tax=Nephila pilipes TaxID=299642 RepID=A0A8X6MQN7_NEPPI|nr:hypothetical protein NPIL_568571 [Nephila pilipes]